MDCHHGQSFTEMFGKDNLVYVFNEKLVCEVDEADAPTFTYIHDQWEKTYDQSFSEWKEKCGPRVNTNKFRKCRVKLNVSDSF